MGVARIAGTLLEPAALGRNILDQFQDVTAGKGKIGDQRMRAGKAGDGLHIAAHALRALDDAAAEQLAIEIDRGLKICDGQADVVETGHASRSGMMSRAKTSAMVSGRLIHSAWAPLTRIVPGRGMALKLAEAAS